MGAEFIGTFILIFAGTATAIVNQKTQGSETLIGLAASTGLAVMIVILSTGHISGAHLNPAVTIAFAALKHFPRKHVGLIPRFSFLSFVDVLNNKFLGFNFWAGTGLHRSTSNGVTVCCIWAKRSVSSDDGRGSDNSFRGIWSSFCSGIYH